MDEGSFDIKGLTDLVVRGLAAKGGIRDLGEHLSPLAWEGIKALGVPESFNLDPFTTGMVKVAIAGIARQRAYDYQQWVRANAERDNNNSE